MNSKQIKYYSLWLFTTVLAIIALRDLFPAFLKKVDWLTLISTLGAIASFIYQIRQSTKETAKDGLRSLEFRFREETNEIREDLLNSINSIKNSLCEDVKNLSVRLNDLLLRLQSHEREPGHQKVLNDTITINQKVLVLESKMEVLSVILNSVLNTKAQAVIKVKEDTAIDNLQDKNWKEI